MNPNSNRETVVSDRTRVVGNVLFTTHFDRCLYLGKSAGDRSRWLKQNTGRRRYIEDIQQEAALPRPSVEAIFQYLD